MCCYKTSEELFKLLKKPTYNRFLMNEFENAVHTSNRKQYTFCHFLPPSVAYIRVKAKMAFNFFHIHIIIIIYFAPKTLKRPI